jgi:NTP pyrophosphatase (non-canonical NTP hydrolase)
MTLQELNNRALEIRKQYEVFEKQRWGRTWTTSDLALGFMGDLGDFVKLAQAKEGIRPPVDDLDNKLERELADCMWCVFVLANKYDIDVEKMFMNAMDKLEAWISENSLPGKNGSA